MLQAHLNAVENHLLEISRIPANSGHSLHKGTPREAFIKEFLVEHLSEQVAVGTGEIIAADSKPGDTRNQMDIVIYKRNYPKINYGGGINAFLVESVAATIEVKSILDKDGLEQAIKAAHTIKNLPRHINTSFQAGYIPPAVLNYVVAYDGPASMYTVLDWLGRVHLSLDIIPKAKDWANVARNQIPSPSIDGIFVLGKGFIFFDNLPLSIVAANPDEPDPRIKWGATNTSRNNLFYLFMSLTTALGGISGSWLDPRPYVEKRMTFGPGSLRFLYLDDEETS